MKTLTPEIIQAASDTLLSHWADLRHEGAMPKRKDINPVVLKGALQYAFIAKTLASGDARFVMAGSAISETLGFDASGMVLSTFLVATSVAHLYQAIDLTIKTKTPHQMMLRTAIHTPLSTTPNKTAPAIGRLILCPMADDHGTVNRLFGLLMTPTKLPIGQHGYRVSPASAVDETHPQSLAMTNDRYTGFAESQSGFQQKHRPKLRVITGGYPKNNRL